MPYTIKNLKDYKASLYSALSRDLAEFEKNFLLITAGILAFSITFIKDIVKLDSVDNLVFLYCGWGLIALAIGIMMFTFLKSAYASDNISKEIDRFQEVNNKWDEAAALTDAEFNTIRTATKKLLTSSKSTLKTLRGFAIISFILGLGCFGYFVADNIKKNRKTEKVEESTIIYNKKTNKFSIGEVSVSSNDSVIIIKN